MNDEEDKFVTNVEKDIKDFIEKRNETSVLIFPPVNKHRRFLIHSVCEGLSTLFEIATFSIGTGLKRRTVVCWKQQILINKWQERNSLTTTTTLPLTTKENCWRSNWFPNNNYYYYNASSVNDQSNLRCKHFYNNNTNKNNKMGVENVNNYSNSSVI